MHAKLTIAAALLLHAVHAQPITVTLVDKAAAAPVRNRPVAFVQEIRCVRAPCPPLPAGAGKTGPNGELTIPDKIRRNATHLSVPGYRPVPLPAKSGKLELLPAT